MPREASSFKKSSSSFVRLPRSGGSSPLKPLLYRKSFSSRASRPSSFGTGPRSALSFKLYTSSQTAGALNLFALEPGAFDAEAETIGAVLAAHAAAAIIASRQNEQLESALSTRDRIGQAKGILMERFAIDAFAAFDLLRRLSQESNVKLIDIAEKVVADRRAKD